MDIPNVTIEKFSDSRPFTDLTDKEKAHVVVVYTKYHRGEWLISTVPQPGYEIQYTIDKGRSRLYYDTYTEAERAAERYNKKRAAQIKGKQKKLHLISWDDVEGTIVHTESVWFHYNPSWLYSHLEIFDDELDAGELIREDLDKSWPDDNHTNREFLEILFSTPRFAMYSIKRNPYTGKEEYYIDRSYATVA